MLDIGLGSVRDLKLVREVWPEKTLELYGIGDQRVDRVKVVDLDLECEQLPFSNNYFDLTICNQVFEHLKNWLWVLHEQVRVTKVGERVIVGFPNLSAFHCRIQLMLGFHPSCIKIDDAHVGGFTDRDFRRVINRIDGLEIEYFKGANMYGVPPAFGKKLAHLFPTFAVSLFYLIRKKHAEVDVIGLYRDIPLETRYFTGS